jgi:acyl carrier protein
MDRMKIQEIVISVITDYCQSINNESIVSIETALIGSNRILDSMGLVNVIVDIEAAFLDEDIEITLTSEAAMSARISPFRSVGSLCNFIAKQLAID